MHESPTGTTRRPTLADTVRGLTTARKRLMALNLVTAVLWPVVVVLVLFERSLWVGIAVVLVGALLLRGVYRVVDARLARSEGSRRAEANSRPAPPD